jgi:hypothetical protein
VWIGFHRVDSKIDLLKELCGVDHYDLDDQELIVDDKQWKLQPVKSLLGPVSYLEALKE